MKTPDSNPNNTEALPDGFFFKLLRLRDTYRGVPGTHFRTPFKSIDGSCLVPAGKRLEATVRWGGEGGTKYWTGFHVIQSLSEARRYAGKFKDPRDLHAAVVYAEEIFAKPTNRRVGLAKYMTVMGPYYSTKMEDHFNGGRDFIPAISWGDLPAETFSLRMQAQRWLSQEPGGLHVFCLSPTTYPLHPDAIQS